jgi:hypothetical protein
VPVGPVAHGLRRAYARCSAPSFSGGPVWLAQWVKNNRDRDVTCPVLHGVSARQHLLTPLLGGTYRMGDSGPLITTLQRGMNMRPQYVTGVFDERTERVLLAFQRIRSFPLTGVATDLELEALGAGTVTSGSPNRMATVFTAY